MITVLAWAFLIWMIGSLITYEIWMYRAPSSPVWHAMDETERREAWWRGVILSAIWPVTWFLCYFTVRR